MKIKSISKQALAVLLSLAVLASTLMLNTLSVFADGAEEIWNGDIADGYARGDGSEATPYIIETPAQLAFLAQEVAAGNAEYNSKHYKLAKDIYLNNIEKDGETEWYNKSGLNTWTYGDSDAYVFAGTLDGDGHVIKGLYKNGTDRAGLFGAVNTAVIENLGIEHAYFNISSQAGAFASKIIGPAKFSNCYVADTVTIRGNEVGGYAGHSWFGGTTAASFTDCYSAANVTSINTDGWWQPLCQGAFVGILNNDSDPYNFTRCYSATNLGFIGNNRRGDALTNDVYTNCYTISDYDSAMPEIIQVSLDNMKGEAALTNMPGLFEGEGANAWITVEGSTPQLSVFGVPEEPDEPEEPEVPEIWDGIIATGYAGGDGSEDNPYIIKTHQQLAFLAQEVAAGNAEYNSKHYKLAKDIYLNDVTDSGDTKWYNRTDITLNTWTYGDSDAYVFAGTLDGDGHVIKGLYKNGTDRAGLFGAVNTAVIENLGIEHAYFNISSQAGAFASKIIGPAKFSNCYVADTVTIRGNEVGGYAGHSWFGGTTAASFTDCYSAANVTSISADSWWQPLCQGAFVGILNNDSDPYNFTRCYSATNLGFIGNNRRDDALKSDVYTNCYTISDYDSAMPEIIQVSLDNMKGEAALTNMPGLFGDEAANAWITVEGSTPQLSVFGVPEEPDEPEEPEVPEIWDGIIATGYAGGDGSEDNPYIIKTHQQLAFLAQEVAAGNAEYNSKHYKLAKDIYLNDVTDSGDTKWYNRTDITLNTWTYGDDQNNAFTGTLDGDGHVIRGLYKNGTGKAGLFGAVQSNAVIKNLGIESCYFEVTEAAGGFVSKIAGSVEFRNCYADDTVSVTGINVSGFAGQCWAGAEMIRFTDCYSAAASRSLSSDNYWMPRTQAAFLGSLDSGDTYFNFTRCYSAAAANLTFIGGNAGGPATTNDAYTDCYSLATPDDTGVTQVSLENMTGANAVTNMSGLFGNEAANAWYVMTGATPELMKFTGKIEIDKGDLNLDAEVDLLDLVRLAQVKANVEGAAINESNTLMRDHSLVKDHVEALKIYLLFKDWSNANFQ